METITDEIITDEMIAKNKVERFISRFQPSYRWLACHGALPLVLTPELVNYLRVQFLRSEEVPWIAEADLLLSDLCRPVGYELYVMDKDVKLYLLDELRKEFGDERVKEVAHFLVSYVKHLTKTNPFLTAKDRKTQEWGAMLYLNSDEVINEINQQISNNLLNKAELARLRKIAQDFTEQIKNEEDKEKFSQLAQNITDSLRNPEVNGKEETSGGIGLDDKEFDVKVAKIEVKELVDFSLLENLLFNQQWKEANEETQRIMLSIMGKKKSDLLNKEDLQNFPINELKKLDLIWIKYSHNHFGFSVQKQIWLQQTDGEIDLKTERQLGDILGWRENNNWKSYNQLSFDENAPTGHLPTYRRKWFSVRDFLEKISTIDFYKIFQSESVFLNRQGEIIRGNFDTNLYFEEELAEGIKLNMMQIPAGEFWMGTEDEEIERLVKKFKWDGFRREKPQHKVTIKQEFYMSQTPITQGQWEAVRKLPEVGRELKENPSKFKGDDNLPVEQVSWYDAVEFCARLSRETGKTYRLPSEAEWEYAYRAINNQSSSTNEEKIEEIKTIPLEELNLSTRIYNSLKQAEINTISDLCQYSQNQLLKLNNFWEESLQEVINNLEQIMDIIITPKSAKNIPLQELITDKQVLSSNSESINPQPNLISESPSEEKTTLYPPFSFGETITDKLANYRASRIYEQETAGEYRQKTTPVKQFDPNGFGLYDMHGNLWEWCADTYYDNYENAPNDGRVWDKENNDNRYQNYLEHIDILLNDSRNKVLRGGSWDSPPSYCRSACRLNFNARVFGDLGFRVVCS